MEFDSYPRKINLNNSEYIPAVFSLDGISVYLEDHMKGDLFVR